MLNVSNIKLFWRSSEDTFANLQLAKNFKIFYASFFFQNANETIAIKAKVIEDQTDSIRKLKQVSP